MTLVADDPSVGIFIPAMVLSMTADEGGMDQFTTVLEALSGAVEPAQDAVKDFLAQTGQERAQREALIEALPFSQRVRARRLIEDLGSNPP